MAHACLDWVAGDGFAAYWSRYDLDYASAHEFRNRLLIAALRRGATGA